ncbi:MaoC like domain-containing protein [Pseudonocardia thermophila]|jgi:Acyl dehydratase|uniref:MaoC like domain-containing protein n=1 Tax=Pseudonocardia thermophila TaxID=1848 RepID=A0A1M6Q424_PSETH|nr:MaoC family dehydratase [Pseudonocardia thermophila]SHK14982.1 MaoC like domain-containing protein [Pseudonocardia thermophila]
MSTVVTRTFTQQDLDDFGVASGGDGRIHTDPEFAARTRFGRPVVQGLYLLAVVEEAIRQARPDWHDTGDVVVRFRRPVLVGDTLRVHLTPAGSGELTIEATTASGVVLTGTARAVDRTEES